MGPVTRLQELGLTVGDLDFGGIDAESDFGLDDYFVTTPYVRYALEGRRTQFLGRKGSGKSALFKQIPRLANAKDSRLVTIAITPDQYSWSALKQYQEQGLLPEHAHTNAWKFTLIVETTSKLLAIDESWSGEAKTAMETLRKFLQDNFGDIDPGFLKSASSILKGLNSFNLSAFGFGVGVDRERADQTLTPAVIERLVALIEAVVEQRGVVIALDRLDDSWDGSEESRSLLIGLLKAAKDLNDRLGGHGGRTGLRIDVFLRSDIYDDLRFDDKDKHRQLEESIVWTTDLLREMVNKRLPKGVLVDGLFEAGDMRGSISPFNYIVKRTFLRPREVLQFLDECQRKAGPSALEISKDDIRAAEERYSKWKVDDLRQEFDKVFPDFGRLLECLRQQVHRYDSLEDLKSLLQQRDPKLVEKHGSRRLLESLFEYSVIGVRIANQGSTRFKSEDSELTLPTSGAAYIHQSLYKGLAIRETRKVGDSGAGQLNNADHSGDL
jgi:hypothetical protein